jgi:hypothetical protein
MAISFGWTESETFVAFEYLTQAIYFDSCAFQRYSYSFIRRNANKVEVFLA